MKNSELIEFLKEYPGDTDIFISLKYGPIEESISITNVTNVGLFKGKILGGGTKVFIALSSDPKTIDSKTVNFTDN